jgi:hypothetical protein
VRWEKWRRIRKRVFGLSANLRQGMCVSKIRLRKPWLTVDEGDVKSWGIYPITDTKGDGEV